MTDQQPSGSAEVDRRNALKLGAGLGVGGLAALAGCSGGGSDAEETATESEMDDGTSSPTEMMGTQRGGTFNVGAQQGLQTMSPFQGFLADYLLGEAMYDRLTYVDQDFEVHPNLATEYSHNDDYTEWTFQLREDATFANTDGEPVTAEDVKASYDYLTSDDFSGSASSLSGVESLTVEDETTVTVELASTDLDFPKRVSETGGAFFVAPKSVLEDDPSMLEETDYGSGPVTVTNRDNKNIIEFEATPDYHPAADDGKPLPYFDELNWDILSDEIQRANALADGTIDAVSRLSPQVEDRLGDEATMVENASGLQFPIPLDTTIEPFDDVRVRKAVKHALDRTEIVAAVSGDGILGHHSGITPVHSYYNDDLPVDDTFGQTANPEQARSLLEEAGYGDGVELPTFHYDDGYPQKEVIAQLFQQQMKQVGIEFEIKRLTEETWLSEYWNTDGKWYVTNYSTRVLGETVLQLALVSDGPWNEANWSNDEFDEAFENAVTATDPEVKAENLKRAQEINHREGAWVGTYHPSIYGAHKEYVSGYELYPTEVKDFVTKCAVEK
jgi:ABC-type transport system substrate-binding protein